MTTPVENSSFTTYFGNDILGMYITWGVDAGQTETIGATDELTMSYVINLYAANLNTNGVNYTNGNPGALVPGTADSPWKFFFYTTWLMSSGDVATGGPDSGAGPYDAMLGALDMTVAENSSLDTLDVAWD